MSEVKSIVEENEELKKAIIEASESLKGYEKDYDELCEENEKLKAELEALKQEATYDEEAMDEDEEEAMEDEEEAMDDEEAEDEEKEAESDQVELQAKALAKALRDLGVVKTPVTTKPQAVQMSNEEVMEKFGAITDPRERGLFFAKHRNQLFN